MQALDSDTSNKVAVVLNANAKRVSRRVVERLKEQNPGADFFHSHSLEEADEIAGTVLARGYPTVLTGGGDGTIVQTIRSLFHKTNRIQTEGQFKRDHRWLQPVPSPKRPLPSIGILKLGTGNALASVVGAGRYDQDLTKICRMFEEGNSPHQLSLPFMESDGDVFPFAGLGWDAAILNDYNRLKENTRDSFVRFLTHSVLGYLIAGVGMTAPQMMLRRPPEVEIRTLGDATLIGSDGTPAKHFSRGAVLYRGPINLVACSTVPYYGFGFTLFPFTHGIEKKFQIRLSTMGVPEALAHLPSIWKGAYRSERLLDFHCERVTMSFSRPVPYQVGGDAKGERESLTIGVAESPVEFVDYRTSLQLVGSAASRPSTSVQYPKTVAIS